MMKTMKKRFAKHRVGGSTGNSMDGRKSDRKYHENAGRVRPEGDTQERRVCKEILVKRQLGPETCRKST